MIFKFVVIIPHFKYNLIASNTYLESKSAVIVNLGLNCNPNLCLAKILIEQKKIHQFELNHLCIQHKLKNFGSVVLLYL